LRQVLVAEPGDVQKEFGSRFLSDGAA
jgi:hypothetical protein